MNSQANPWEGIADNAPEGQLHVRRADASHPHDFFWGLDSHGHRLLIYRARSLVTDRKLPSLRGISIELIPESLLLRLQQQSDIEMFVTLCLSLIERTRSIRSGTDTLDCILNHLERWQRFLGKPPSTLLTDEELRGLFCELRFLELELLPRFGPAAVEGWHGPAGHPQDFAVGTTLFEIKSHMAGSAPVVMISSAEQLWHAAGDLFLVVYTIGISPQHTEEAPSLLDLVNRIRSMLPTQQDLETFENRLTGMGYFDHPDYGRTAYVVTLPDCFLVSGNFPRVDREAMRPGVCRLRYGIELAACLPFRSVPDWNGLGADNGN